MSKTLRKRPELPPSSVTVTTAVISATGGRGFAPPVGSAYFFSPLRSVDKPVPPPMATIRKADLSGIYFVAENNSRN